MNFFGDDLLAWLVLALGGALAVGNLLALVRPKEPTQRNGKTKEQEIKNAAKGERQKAPLVRSIIMITFGTGVSIWALASLLG